MNTEKYIIEAHQAAIESGFYDCPECRGIQNPPCSHPGCFNHITHPCEGCGRIGGICQVCQGTGINPNRNIGELLMLIITELSEAVEAHRKNRFADENRLSDILEVLKNNPRHYSVCFEDALKDTFQDEIADTFIRLFDLCGYWNIPELRYCEDHGIELTDNISECLYMISKRLPAHDTNACSGKHGLNSFYSALLDFCNLHNINIEPFIIAKMEYNKTRQRKHGKEY